MNKSRRDEINKALGLLQSIKDDFYNAKSFIETAASDEREYYDNMPENMQNGDRGSAAEASASALEEVQSAFEEFDPDDLITKLEEAMQ